MKRLMIFMFMLSLNFATANAATTSWNLPIELSPANTDVHFEVDSTWHTVEGIVHNCSGRIWLETPNDPTSIRAELKFPVSSFDTDNRSRDKELRTVMAEQTHPAVSFITKSAARICDPQSLSNGQSCTGQIEGEVTIRDITKSISVPISVLRQANGFEVKGAASLNWSDFGVEDPSIFIAKLDKVVRISFTTHLPDTAAN